MQIKADRFGVVGADRVPYHLAAARAWYPVIWA